MGSSISSRSALPRQRTGTLFPLPKRTALGGETGPVWALERWLVHRLLGALGNPPIVIPTHWDRFNVPYSYSQEPAVRRLQPFIEEVKAASPNTRVIVPEYFRAIAIP